MFLLWDNCPDVEIGPLLQFPHLPRAGPVLLTTPDTPLVSLSYRVFLGLCILFCWSGTPVCFQLVFWMHFCLWGCVPDVSVERDVLHIHLLLCHLVLSLELSSKYYKLLFIFFKDTVVGIYFPYCRMILKFWTTVFKFYCLILCCNMYPVNIVELTDALKCITLWWIFLYICVLPRWH